MANDAVDVSALENVQLLRHDVREIVVSTSGGSLQETANNMFQVMRKQIFNEFAYPIVRLEATEVRFESIECEERTERFFFLFWPRVKRAYKARAKILVNIDYLDIKEDQ